MRPIQSMGGGDDGSRTLYTRSEAHPSNLSDDKDSPTRRHNRMPGGPIGSMLPPAFLNPGTSDYQYGSFPGNSRPASEDGALGDERPVPRPRMCSDATGRVNAADR